jgi:olefin beta-lactone synthetase
MATDRGNIVSLFEANALRTPEAVAMHYPAPAMSNTFAQLSYGQMATRMLHIARGLNAYGVMAGSKVALMVRPGPEFFLLMFALFKLRAVPVLIDPGIARRALKQCLDEAQPSAFIGIPIAHVARIALGWARASVRLCVTVGSPKFWTGPTLAAVERRGESAAALADQETNPEELAAILFTSGSTGVPKGVEYLHQHFLAQVHMLRREFAITPGMISLPTFPPFALFDAALGATSVIPPMDFAKPARANPAMLSALIERFRVQMLFGSPALLRNLSEYTNSRQTIFQSLKKILSAGAPVTPDLANAARAMMMPDGRLWTPYGATESLPVAIIEGQQLDESVRAKTAMGCGICVGKPLIDVRVRIIATSDQVTDDTTALEPYQAGEIVVSGPTTTRRYHKREAQTLLAKIDAADGLWHRMGDLGYFDADGNLWYLGRKSHRVETASKTLFSESIEGVFNTLPWIKRSALVGLGERPTQTPAICVEATSPPIDWQQRLQETARKQPLTEGIQLFYLHPGLPVDIRHNAKINRERLAAWVARKISQ